MGNPSAADCLKHGDLYKMYVSWPGGSGERIPAWTRRVVQDPVSLIFSAQVWEPANPYRFKHKVKPPSNLCSFTNATLAWPPKRRE